MDPIAAALAPDGDALDPVAFAPPSGAGRSMSRERTVRLGDVSPRGRLRLDAFARYLQDVANDDATSSGIADPDGWVVRRTDIAVLQPARLRESVTLTTYCSGIGASWAERRTTLRGSAGAHLEASSLWVQVDVDTGRSRRLDASFRAIYGPSAAGRSVSARLRHGDPPAEAVAAGRPFPLRFADFDPFGHVNNAVHWAMLEEVLAARPDRSGSMVAELEYRRPLERGAEPTLVVVDGATGDGARADGARGDDALDVWVVDESGVAASARVVQISR